jgi:hypothetical protein
MVMLGLLCDLSAFFVITGFEATLTVLPVLYSTSQNSLIVVFKTSNSASSTLVPASLRFAHTSICRLSQSTLFFVACTDKFIVFPKILIGFTITCTLVLDHFCCDFCSDSPFFCI